MFANQGELTAAEQALDIAIGKRDVVGEMWRSYEIGSYLSAHGRSVAEIQRGITLLKRALELARAHGHPGQVADVLINLGSNLYNATRGDQADNKLQALELIREAKTIYTEEKYPSVWALCATNEALCLLWLDHPDNTVLAVELLERARRLRERGSVDWAYTSLTLGLAYRKCPASSVGAHRELLVRAARALKAACIIFEASNMFECVVRSEIQRIETELRRMRLECRTRDVTALHIHAGEADYQVTAEDPARFNLETHMLDLAVMNPDFFGSEEATPSVVRLSLSADEVERCGQLLSDVERLRQSLTSHESAHELARCEALAANLLLVANGPNTDALERLHRAVGSTSVAELPTEWTEWAALAIGVSCELGEFQRGARIARSAINGYALILKDMSSRVHRQQAQQRFAMLSRIAAACLAADGDAVGALEAIENGRQTEWFGTERTYADIQAAATQLNATLCYLVSSPIGTDLLLVHPEADTCTHSRVTEVTSATIAALILGMSPPSGGLHWVQNQADDFGDAIHRILEKIKPIAAELAERLADAHAERCLLVGTGLTSSLPLLQCDVAGLDAAPRRLADAYVVSWTPSAAALGNASAAESRNNIQDAVVLHPDRADLTKLSGAAIEVSIIERMLVKAGTRVATLTGPDATGTALASYLQHCDLLHLAAHAYSDVLVGSDTYLCLSDGDVSFADLGIGSRLTTRLVTLSACQSGHFAMRMPEEAAGLAADLIAAGACCVVASLWPVDDDATVLLMAKFYELLLGEAAAGGMAGFTPVRALREAQSWLRELSVEDEAAWISAMAAAGLPLVPRGGPPGTQPYRSPQDWAAFVTLGR